jgi:hypothetical protein
VSNCWRDPDFCGDVHFVPFLLRASALPYIYKFSALSLRVKLFQIFFSYVIEQALQGIVNSTTTKRNPASELTYAQAGLLTTEEGGYDQF